MKSGTRSSGRSGTRSGTVKTHYRTVNGKRVKVQEHKRRGLNPGRAGRNAKRAFRAAKKKRNALAFGLGSLAALELGSWLVLRSSAFGLTVLGIGAVGIAAVLFGATGGKK